MGIEELRWYNVMVGYLSGAAGVVAVALCFLRGVVAALAALDDCERERDGEELACPRSRS